MTNAYNLSADVTVAVGDAGTLTFTGTETAGTKFSLTAESVEVYFKYNGTTIATGTITI